jgi:ferredoxin-NADP reductase
VATPLRPSHYLELAFPLLCTHETYARVDAVIDETRDARTLVLRPGRAFARHRAGQHVRVGVEIDGRRLTRTFSLSSSPDDPSGRVAVTVKAVRGGRVTPFVVRDLAPGALVTLSNPEGDFVLPDGPAPRALFVTGGSGITPVMSMLRTLALRGDTLDVVHVHYERRAEDVIFSDELRRLADARVGYRLHVVETRDTPMLRFSPAQLSTLCPDAASREVWACGPAGMLDAVEAFLPRAHTERFQPRLVASGSRGGEVHFARSGKTARADGKTPLLVVAETAGVNAPNGCRMGICHTCDATLAKGCVRDLRTGRLHDEPGARVQVCVCAAEGDVELSL